MLRRRFLCATLFVITLSPSLASAVELGPTLKIGSQQLVLNGSGTREKYFLDLYVAGLYLTQPNNQPAEIINADAPMAIRIVNHFEARQPREIPLFACRRFSKVDPRQDRAAPPPNRTISKMLCRPYRTQRCLRPDLHTRSRHRRLQSRQTSRHRHRSRLQTSSLRHLAQRQPRRRYPKTSPPKRQQYAKVNPL